jgi:hypothetical protein
MEDVSIKGLVIAIIVALLLNTLGGVAGVSLFAEAMTQESVLAIEKQTHFLFFSLLLLWGYLQHLQGAILALNTASWLHIEMPLFSVS